MRKALPYQIVVFTKHGTTWNIAPTWNDKLELLDGFYSVSDVQK